MALTQGSTSNSGTTAIYDNTGGSWNHTTLTGENSLWVHVGVHNTTVTGITFNGDALTKAVESNSGTYTSYWYYIVNPDIGTYAIAVTYADTGYGAGGAIAFSGTDTASPLGVTGTATGSSTAPSKSVTTTKRNSIVLQGVYGSGEGSDNAATPGANETEIYEVSTANKAITQATRESTTAIGSYTMSETFSVSCTWVISVVEVKVNTSTQTIQPSTKDNYIQKSSTDANNGNSTELKVLNLDAAIHRILITFDVSAYTAGSANINSATLGLYYYTDNGDTNPSGLQVNVYKMLRTTWTEGDGTSNQDSNWTDYTTDTPWATAGCGDSTNDYTTTNSANTTFPASAGAWVSWDITDIVKDAIDNNSSIVNLMIRFNAENVGSYSNVSFYSRTGTPGDTTLRPKLVIDYITSDYVMEVLAGNYTYTGADIALNKGWTMIVTAGNYIYTGLSVLMQFTGWIFKTKPTSTWTKKTKPTTTWTQKTKPSSTWTYKSKT